MFRALANSLSLLLCVLAGLGVYFLPQPEGLSPQAWQLLAIFTGTILAVIIKPIPLGATAMISLTLLTVSSTLSFKEAFSAYANPTIWLVLIAFFIARGFVVTGLGARIGYWSIAVLGRHTLGVAYGLVFSDLIMAPAIPSVTARSGGIIFPILQSLAGAFDSHPQGPSRRKIGAFLIVVAYQATVITSAMFVTAMAANPLIVQLAADAGVELTWVKWAKAAAVPGLISLLIIPLVVYFLYPPEVKSTADAPRMAKEHLATLGPMKVGEWIMAGTFVLLVTLWVLGAEIGISATETAMIGLSILLLTGVLDWKDLIKQGQAWETYVWFGALVMMAGQLNTLGVMSWFTSHAMGLFAGLSWPMLFPLVLLLYVYSHYFFASSTAHVGAMYSAFLLLAIGAGTPPVLAAMGLAVASNLMGCLTHYGLAPGPILYGSGYVTMKEWWTLGFVISLIHLAIWSTVGSFWWAMLGLW